MVNESGTCNRGRVLTVMVANWPNAHWVPRQQGRLSTFDGANYLEVSLQTTGAELAITIRKLEEHLLKLFALVVGQRLEESIQSLRLWPGQRIRTDATIDSAHQHSAVVLKKVASTKQCSPSKAIILTALSQVQTAHNQPRHPAQVKSQNQAGQRLRG